MRKLSVQTLSRGLRHVKKRSRTLLSLRAGITLLLLVCAVAVLVVYGIKTYDRLDARGKSSVAIRLGDRLAGRVTGEDLDEAGAGGRSARSLLELLDEYGIKPLQGETLSCRLAGQDQFLLDSDEEVLASTQLVLDGEDWLLLLPDGSEKQLDSITVRLLPPEDETP